MQEQLTSVSRAMHDRCLRACLDRKADITENELLALNIVAVGWAGDEPVTKQEFEAAGIILARLGV